MAFEKRRELLFVYSVKDANPNGDPLNANHPRYDESSGQILVSDVRIKRTIRDQFVREGKDVFVDGEPKTINKKINELEEKFGTKQAKEALSKCIDTRLFGVTFALGNESFSWTGPVQWKWGRSLHRAKVEFVQGTAAFATKDDSEQRSFRNEYIVPFALIAGYAIANQYASQKTGATSEDLDEHFDVVWKGHENLITRSKIGHKPRFLIEVTYKEGYNSAIGSMDEKIGLKGKDNSVLSEEEELALRSIENVILDIEPLVEEIISRKDSIEKVRVRKDRELVLKGLDKLQEGMGSSLKLEER